MVENEKGEAEAKQSASSATEESHQQIWSWGAGTDGQLGSGKLEDELIPQLIHFPSLSSARPISMLACGGTHVIAMTDGGEVLTWGRGTSGQLGHGDMLSYLSPTPVNFLDGYLITHVSAGWSHSGFVSDSGWLFTCGDGSFGQLGHGDYNSHSTPLKVSFFANSKRRVEQIACGMRHSLVLLKDCSGTQVYGFGSGKRGQLGICSDKIKSVNLPQVACGFEHIEIISISANGDHSAALSADGQLFIWGRGFPGNPDVSVPQHLVSSLQFTEVALGWNHALILTAGGEVFIIGGDRHGALSDLEKTSSGRQSSDSTRSMLDRVSGVEGVEVVEIAAGAEHSALLTGDGEIMTWGWGEHGQLGLGNTNDQTNPQTVNLCLQTHNQQLVFKIYCGSGFTFAIACLQITCD